MSTSYANASRRQSAHPSNRGFLLLAFTAAMSALMPEAARAAALYVAAGGDYQAALDAARHSDTIEPAAGATFVGPFTLPNKAGVGRITTRTDAPDSSPQLDGQRITPTYSAPLILADPSARPHGFCADRYSPQSKRQARPQSGRRSK